MRLQGAPRRRPAINVTSLIDVLFLLLTFFLVSTQFIDQIELPKMSHSQQIQHGKQFIVSVAADGQMTLDGQIVETGKLQDVLGHLVGDINNSGGLIVRPDHHLTMGQFAQIYDQAMSAGIEKIKTAMDKPSE